MPVPTTARRMARATAVLEAWPGCQVPSASLRVMVRWLMTATMLMTTPSATSATPVMTEWVVEVCVGVCWVAENSRRKRPKRLTAKPTPMRPRPVRIQARKVRSAAK
jgi:hypothetical protein